MRNVALPLLISLLAATANAEWLYINKIDDFTDENIRAAVWQDDDHRIQLSRQEPTPEGHRNIWIFINRKAPGTISPTGLVEYRIDKLDTREVDIKHLEWLEKTIKRERVSWQPDTIAFFVQGDWEDAKCTNIEPFLTGNTLRIRYRTDKMDTAAFAVPLEGQREKLIEILELEHCGL